MQPRKFTIRDIEVPSEFYLAPINTGFASLGEPSENLIAFHSERSGRSIGISYVGNVAINEESISNSGTPFFSRNLKSWGTLVATIKNNGSLAGVQLSCRKTKMVANKGWINNHQRAYLEKLRNEVNDISERELRQIVSEFIESAAIASELGFDVIQIHAAHGYLLSCLLSPVLNTRRTVYGADPIEILNDIVEGVRGRAPNVILDIRVSLREGLKSENEEMEAKTKIVERLVDLDFDQISLSNGFYDVNKQLIYPLRNWGHGVYFGQAIPFAKRFPHKVWNIAGNIWALDEISDDLPKNLTFSVGRSLIADPEFVSKSVSNEVDRIHCCERNNLCHYYSRSAPHIACPVDSYLKQFVVSDR